MSITHFCMQNLGPKRWNMLERARVNLTYSRIWYHEWRCCLITRTFAGTTQLEVTFDQTRVVQSAPQVKDIEDAAIAFIENGFPWHDDTSAPQADHWLTNLAGTATCRQQSTVRVIRFFAWPERDTPCPASSILRARFCRRKVPPCAPTVQRTIVHHPVVPAELPTRVIQQFSESKVVASFTLQSQQSTAKRFGFAIQYSKNFSILLKLRSQQRFRTYHFL